MAAANATTAKTEVSADAALLAKVQERVDFFFGDVNFGRDRFLRNRTMAIPDRYIPISVILTFNTLKKLTVDTAVVVAAAKNSNIVEVNEAGVGLRRKVPFDASTKDDEVKRRIYAAGFPGLNIRWEKVRDAFKSCGKVTYVRLRRDKDTKSFLGSVFVDFATEAAAAKAVETTPDYEGTKLTDVKMFLTWLRESRADKGGRGGKKTGHGVKQETVETVEEINKEETNKFVLRVSGYPEDSAWQDIKRTFVDFSESKGLETSPAFVDLFEGVAFLRYNATPEDCKSMLEEIQKSKPKIGETEVTVEAASPEERAAYWMRMFANKKEKSVNKKIQRRTKDSRGKQRYGKRQNRGGGGRSFKNQKRSRDDQTPSSFATGANTVMPVKPSVDAAATKPAAVVAEPPAKKQKA